MQNRVKELREQKRLSQTALATRIGCSQNTISKIEKGDCDPKGSLLVEMSKLFGVTIDYILCQSDQKYNDETMTRYSRYVNTCKEYVERMDRLSPSSQNLMNEILKHMSELEEDCKDR